MARKICFYLPRDNMLKGSAPIIDALLAKHQGSLVPVIIVPGWPISKTHLQPDPKKTSDVFGGKVDVHAPANVDALVQVLEEEGIAAFVNVSVELSDIPLSDQPGFFSRLKRLGIKTAATPYLIHQDFLIPRDPEAVLGDWDLLTTMGPRGLRYIEHKLSGAAPGVRKQILDRTVAVGYPELDGIGRNSDLNIRRKYKLPAARPIIYVSTAVKFFPRFIHSPGRLSRWRLRGCQSIFSGPSERPSESYLADLSAKAMARMMDGPVLSYRHYLSSLRKLADRNDAILVAKTRTKHQDPDYLGDYVDAVFFDESFFPFTTLDLMQVSSLYFGFYSASAIEAVASGLYSITSEYLPQRLIEHDWGMEIKQFYYFGNSGLWDFPGVSEFWRGAEKATREKLARMEKSSLEDFSPDPNQRERLLSDFLACREGSSERFINALAAIL